MYNISYSVLDAKYRLDVVAEAFVNMHRIPSSRAMANYFSTDIYHC